MIHQYRCETCQHYDKFFSSCKLLFYATYIGGKKEMIHPVIGHKDDWIIQSLGCASHSSALSFPDIKLLKKSIIEVLDTGFESSERDIELVLDRIDVWERGELRSSKPEGV